MILLIISGMAKYSAYTSSVGQGNVFNDMPYSIKALLGISSFDVTTMAGYFAMLFLYIELAVAIHAVLLGSGIISKEERDKTTEFLMAKPVSRTLIISSKLLAALVNVLVLNIVTWFSSIIMVSYYSKETDISKEISMFMLSLFIVQLIFLSLGSVLAAFIHKSNASGSLSVGILLTTFAISRITDLTDRLNFLNVLSPFKYFNYVNLAEGDGLDIVIVILSLALTSVFALSAYIFFKKRDLNV